MSFYVVTDLNSVGPVDPEGNSEAELLTLEYEDRTVLPVFTLKDSFWEYVEARYAGDDHAHPAPVPMDPFRLAELVASFAQAGGLDTLVFNPAPSGEGRLVSTADYCDFIEEIRPRLEDALREGRARYGDPTPGSTAFKEHFDWLVMRSMEAADDIAAVRKERGVKYEH